MQGAVLYIISLQLQKQISALESLLPFGKKENWNKIVKQFVESLMAAG